MAFSLLPREEKFFDLFDQQAKHITDSAAFFLELVKNWSADNPLLKKLIDLEHECDITTHELIDKLNRTFVTPFDREDIYGLATELDDIVDMVQAISERLLLYHVEKIEEDLIGLAVILDEAVSNVSKALTSIRTMNRPRRILDYCIEINRLENRGDRASEIAIGKLFTNTKDPVEIIKWKDLYDMTETAIDKCEDIANTIEGILVKHG